MKTKILILLLFISSFTFSQKPIVDYVKFKDYTTAQKNAINTSDPNFNYIVFDTDLNKYQIYTNGAWRDLLDSANFIAGTNYLAPDGNGSQLTSVNAFWLQGRQLADADGKIWERVPYIKGGGAINLGKIVNFNDVASNPNEYTTRIECTPTRFTIIPFSTGADYDFTVGNSIRLFDDVNIWANRTNIQGVLGINTTSPNNLLFVKSGLDENDKGLTLQSNSNIQDTFTELSFLNSIDSNLNPNLWIRGNRGPAFASSYMTFGTANLERLRILGDGKFAFGKTTADEVIDVDGNVKATGFIGSGIGLTGILDASLSSNVVLKDGSNIFTGNNSFSKNGGNFISINDADGTISNISSGVVFQQSGITRGVVGYAFGDLNKLNVHSNFGDVIISSNSSSAPGSTGSIILDPHTTGIVNITKNTSVSGILSATSVQGNGASLTSLNASNISSGTLADSRLSSNIPLKNAQNVFTQDNLFLNVATNNGISFFNTFNLQLNAPTVTASRTVTLKDESGTIALISDLGKLQTSTFALLPVSPITGQLRVITDANSIAYRGVASGGGGDTALVMYDGTNWIYH